MSAERELVEERWKKVCNGPGDPLDRPQNSEPGRDIGIMVFNTGEVVVDCDNFQDKKCTIGSQTDSVCIFDRLQSETPRIGRESTYRAILANPGISQSEIATNLNIAQDYVSRTVAGLKKDGIVETGTPRRTDPGRPKLPLSVRSNKRDLLK